jgi:hypothetical protein
MVPFVQYVLLYSLKTLFGIESMHALPTLLFSDEALMRLVGCNARQVRHGVCQRGAARRQGPRTTGPICSDTLANNIVQLNLHDLEALFNGVIRALAKTATFGAKVTGIVDATDLETTVQYEGCGQVTRKRKITDKRGKVHDVEVTVYGFKLIVLIDARTKIPLAATVVPIHEHEVLSMRALVMQARINLDGHARLHVLFTLLMFALATAYRRQCEQEAMGEEPVGWQRWRRQLLEQTRDLVIVFAESCYGIFHMAEYSLLVGVNIKDRPSGIGTRRQILAKYGLIAHR